MWKPTASLAVILVFVATIACDTEPGALNPTPLRSNLSNSVSIQPSAVATESVINPSCPIVPPFVGSVSLNVEATGELAFSLQQVQMTFTDTTGLTAPQVTLPAPVLTRQFGSTLIEARSQRTFPFTFPFGCGTRRTGTLVVVVVVRDSTGREMTAETRVPVR
jgi:hypothetical protein